MIRKLLISLILVSNVSLFAANTSVPCDPSLHKYLTVIQKLPEAQELIEKIQREGSLRLCVSQSPFAQFGAFWDLDKRIIFVNLNCHQTAGSVIGSILFEMQNALVTNLFNHYDHLAVQGKINRDNYIRAIEHIEFQNSQNAAALASKGISQGFYPRDARLPVYNDFEEHYYYQQVGGHSALIGQSFDSLISQTRFSAYN